MSIIIQRPHLTLAERFYFPALIQGFKITIGHFLKTLFGKRQEKVTLLYPEEKWKVPLGYRGAPTLVRDQNGREKCVGCQLCEFVCPPRAITIVPGEIASNASHKKVEKYAQSFEIDMLRCIYCGLCEEVCPEQAIFLRQDYTFTGFSRKEMVHPKERLLELGGVMQDGILKWNQK